MTKCRIVAWLVVVWSAQLGAAAVAQDMSFDLEETEKTPEAKPDAAPAQDEAASKGSAEVSAEADVIGALAAEEAPTRPTDSSAARPKEVSEEIYAVEQVYALRRNRVELLPSFGFTLNDPVTSHPAFNLGLNYWITNVLAVGANINWYQGFENESDFGFHVRRSTRLAIRPTEYQMGASLNFTYVPMYGKFAMFNRYIFQWDAYVLGGIGMMRTRPTPVIDAEFRNFDFTNKLSLGNPGIGVRVFVSKWLTVFAEMRDYIYLEKLENLDVVLDDPSTGQNERADKGTWLEDSSTIVNNVLVSVGMTIFFPFTFDYKLPK